MLSGAAILAGVIGDPVSHSLSPRLHGYWLQQLGIDGAYVPLHVGADNLETAIRGLKALGFAGANVTVPHKEAAADFCDEVDEMAERVGAVNTLVIKDGELHGSNTDVFGFEENIRAELGSGRGRAVLLGAGGAARAVIVALQDMGFADIRLMNRTTARAESLAWDFGLETAVKWGAWEEALDGADLLINTTSLGMTGQPALEIDLAVLPNSALVTDLVYNPLETPLLAAARERGNPAVDGLGMLLHQARPGFEAWFGAAPEVTEGLRAHVLQGLG